jgi:Flp pilus assembly pilin Flp
VSVARARAPLMSVRVFSEPVREAAHAIRRRSISATPGQLVRPRILTDRRAVTSFEYALLAGALAFVLFEVMQMPAEALGSIITGLYAGVGGHGPGG